MKVTARAVLAARRPLVALAAGALVLSACGGAAPTAPSSSSPSAQTSPSASDGAPAPSPPAVSDELAVRLVQVGDVTWIYPVAQLTIMADGRVVTPATEPPWNMWRQRRLSAGGVSGIVALASDTGLFTANAEYPMLHRPGAPEWPGMGGSQITIALGHGVEQVRVSGGTWFGDEFEATYNVASPERKALSDLAARLSDLSWLPDDAWLSPDSEAYQPAEYLFITSWFTEGARSGPNVDDVAWPFDGPLVEFGAALRQSSPDMLRCGVVDAGQAKDIIEQMHRLTGADASGVEFADTLRSPEAGVELHLMPMLPDGYPACDDLMVGGA